MTETVTPWTWANHVYTPIADMTIEQIKSEYNATAQAAAQYVAVGLWQYPNVARVAALKAAIDAAE